MQWPADLAPGSPRTLTFQLALVGAGAAWAAALVILFFNASPLYSLPLLAATVAPAVIAASGNPRLFLLMGTAFSAFLGLSINFGRVVHMGGAPSLSIDLVDLFMVPLLLFIIRDRLQGRRTGYTVPAVSLWVLALVALGVLDMVLGPHRKFAAFEVVRMLKCWLLMLVIANECVRERQFHHVVVALAWGLALNLLITAAQFAFKRTLGLQALGEAAPEAILGANLGVYLDSGSVYRVSGLLGHPNLYSAYLAMLVPILGAIAVVTPSRRARAGFAVLAAGGIVALVLTLSRTGWAAFAAAGACLLFFLYLHPALRDRWRSLKNVLPVLLFVGAILAAGPVINRLTLSDSGALDFRWEWLDVAWRMVKDKPVLGFGLNSFSYQILEYVPYSVSRMVDMFGPTWPVVHNIYLLVWSEQGTLGFFCFLALNFQLLLMAYRNTRYTLSLEILMLNAGAFAALVALLVDGIGSFYLRVPGPARVFWVLAGLIVASHAWNVRTLAWRRSQAALQVPPR